MHTVDSRAALPLREPKAVDDDTGEREGRFWACVCEREIALSYKEKSGFRSIVDQCLVHTHGALGRGEGRVTS